MFLAGVIGGWEMVLILVVVLVLFGAKKLPELAKGLGQGIKEFKKATRDVQDEFQSALDDPPRRYPVNNNDQYSIPNSTSASATPESQATGEKTEPKVKVQ